MAATNTTCFDYVLNDSASFQNAMQIVTDRCNVNTDSVLPQNYRGYYVEFTKDVIKTYIQLVCDKSLPEYNLEDLENKEKIEQTVAKQANYELGKTKKIFYEFYYATFGQNNGNSIAQKYIYPLSAYCQFSGCEPPTKNTNFTLPADNPFTAITTSASSYQKYLIPGGIALALVGGFIIYKKNKSKKHKGNKNV